jgi:hypothetical protein
MVRRPEQFRYSGHGEYCGVKGAEVIDSTLVLKVLGGSKGYRRFVLEGIEGGHKEEYYEVEDQRFLGPEGFGEKVAGRAGEEEDSARRKKPLEKSLMLLAERLGVRAQVLRGADRSWKVSRARAMTGYVLVRRGGYALKEVASILGRDVATVSSLISRLADRISADSQLGKEIDRVTKDCLERKA